MKAYVYNGPNEMGFEELKEPKLLEPTDAVIRVAYSALCGMDIKIKNGLLPEVCPGTVLGHEFCGIVEETGRAVKNLKKGDRVAVNAVTTCGICEKCIAGKNENCTNGGWLLGYLIDGCQSEFTRVPFSDQSLTKIPEGMKLEKALFAGNIALSAYQAVIDAKIKKDNSVAVLGSGPSATVAMMVAKSFQPSKIIAVDNEIDRLNKIAESGIADKIVFSDGSDIEKKMICESDIEKVDVAIEASGRNSFFNTVFDITYKDGVISVLSVYPKPLIFCSDKIENRKINFNNGRVNKKAVPGVLDLINSGYINTNFLHTGSGSFEDMEEGYRKFENKKNGFFKWICDHRQLERS